MKHKTTGPKTIEQARALPEVTFTQRMEGGGISGGLPISGDDIMLFTDKDGRAMRPVAWNGAWHKEEAFL